MNLTITLKIIECDGENNEEKRRTTCIKKSSYFLHFIIYRREISKQNWLPSSDQVETFQFLVGRKNQRNKKLNLRMIGTPNRSHLGVQKLTIPGALHLGDLPSVKRPRNEALRQLRRHRVLLRLQLPRKIKRNEADRLRKRRTKALMTVCSFYLFSSLCGETTRRKINGFSINMDVQ